MTPALTFVVATRNRHKASEIAAILGPAARVFTLGDFPDAPKVVEDADTFEGNARKKAAGLALWLAESGALRRGSFGAAPDLVLADDSGLEVDALNGAPGVRSARFAAEGGPGEGNAPDADNNRKLLNLLEGVAPAERTARFRCVVAVTPLPPGGSAVSAADVSNRTVCFEGSCSGILLAEPRGGGGFGYDPLFVPDGRAETFAELGDAVKNRLSHRARALARLADWLSRLPPTSPTPSRQDEAAA